MCVSCNNRTDGKPGEKAVSGSWQEKTCFSDISEDPANLRIASL